MNFFIYVFYQGVYFQGISCRLDKLILVNSIEVATHRLNYDIAVLLFWILVQIIEMLGLLFINQPIKKL